MGHLKLMGLVAGDQELGVLETRGLELGEEMKGWELGGEMRGSGEGRSEHEDTTILHVALTRRRGSRRKNILQHLGHASFFPPDTCNTPVHSFFCNKVGDSHGILLNPLFKQNGQVPRDNCVVAI